MPLGKLILLSVDFQKARELCKKMMQNHIHSPVILIGIRVAVRLISNNEQYVVHSGLASLGTIFSMILIPHPLV